AQSWLNRWAADCERGAAATRRLLVELVRALATVPMPPAEHSDLATLAACLAAARGAFPHESLAQTPPRAVGRRAARRRVVGDSRTLGTKRSRHTGEELFLVSVGERRPVWVSIPR